MLYRIAALAAFLVSADALKIGAGMTRRSAVAKVASLAAVAPLAAFADLKKAGDAEIYANAECVVSNPCHCPRSIARAHTYARHSPLHRCRASSSQRHSLPLHALSV